MKKPNTEIEVIQQVLNKELADFFKEHGIKNFRMISVGNSIASGYSMVRTIKPLLLRNETIEKIMKDNGIDIERLHFARAQNNGDEHIFEWLENNIKLSEMYKLNRNDYSGGITSMQNHGLPEDQIGVYYPESVKDDKGLKEAALESNANLANVIVYNGLTGSFLDVVTRRGNIFKQLISSFDRDYRSLEATLKLIQTNNRKNNSNTQVYICGAPDFLGLKISEIINHKLRKVTKKYANAVYVEPIKSKFFYTDLKATEEEDLTTLQGKIKKYLKVPDIHYNEEEYLKLNNNIIRSILQNYMITKSMINVDRYFYNLSSKVEINKQELVNDSEALESFMTSELKTELKKLEDKNQKKEFLTKIKEYLTERSPFDFFYLGKKEIKEAVNEVGKKL